jgi:hypothetical protein
MKRPGGIYIDSLHFVDRVCGHCQAQLDHKFRQFSSIYMVESQGFGRDDVRTNAKELDIAHRLIAHYSRFFREKAAKGVPIRKTQLEYFRSPLSKLD